jgi:hypothetical protein
VKFTLSTNSPSHSGGGSSGPPRPMDRITDPPLRLTSCACMDMLGRNTPFRKSRNRTEFARSRKSNPNGRLLRGVNELAVQV